MEGILKSIYERKNTGRKMLAVLVDPDKFDTEHFPFEDIHQADMIFVGSSLLKDKDCAQTCISLKERCKLPLILFPGSSFQITSHADAILFMSLISGRNPEYLIGQQITGAPLVKKAGLEVLPTGYILVDSGKLTAAHYISQSLPIPANKPEIASVTAMTGEMLGQKIIYMDGGSGAKQAISDEMIREVAENISSILVVGGGIRTPEQAQQIWSAGADIVVIGSIIEDTPELLQEFIITREVMAKA